MEKRYSKGIDFLRGIAIVSVMLYHLPQYSLQGGNQGVTIFFVISGFLMAKNASYEYEKKQFSILKFYKKRIKRIYPFLLFSILIFILIAGSTQIRMIGHIKGEISSLLLGYNNWWQIIEKVSYFDDYTNSSLFKHYWSLAVELQFYLIFPVLFLSIKRLSKKRGFQLMYVLIGTSILISQFLPYSISYYNTFARMYAFIFGIFGFFNRKNIDEMIAPKKILKFWILMMFLCISVIFPLSSFILISILVSIFTTLLLVLINNEEVENRAKLNKFRIHYIGKISYELYLVHYSAFVLIANLVPNIHPVVEISIVFFITILMVGGYDIFIHSKKKLAFYIRIGAVTLTLGMIMIAPSSRMTGDQKELEQELISNQKKIQNQAIQQGNILFIGDSVMLGSYQELNSLFNREAIIDAKESRQITSLPDILRKYSNLDDYSTIVIGLGTNGVISDDSLDEIFRLLKNKEIFWINIKCPQEWQDAVNQKLEELPNQYRNVEIIDWFKKSIEHPEYFYDDETHLNAEGREAYGKLMSSVLLH